MVTAQSATMPNGNPGASAQPAPSAKFEAPSLPPELMLARMISGYAVSRLIYVAAKLNLADLLKDGPQSADQLAADTQTDSVSLRRIMRGLVALGVFTENESGEFESTGLGRLLQTDAPGALCKLALCSDESYVAWGELLQSVQTGETAFDQVYGMSRYQYLEQYPEAARSFNQAMASISSQLAAAVVAGYDFSQTETAVDIGGGGGTLLQTVLRANPSVRGVLFDKAPALEGVETQLEEAGLGGRCDVVVGDFFKSVPAGGDLYLLSHVLHNWDDDHCIQILKNLRTSMGAGAKLLIVEIVMPNHFSPSFMAYPMAMTDLQMLVMTGGHERTEAEFRRVLEAAGYDLKRVVQLRAMDSIIECVPA